ncbi:MAG: hypothetical protein ACRD1N_01090 [Terriglobia bacterium]
MSRGFQIVITAVIVALACWIALREYERTAPPPQRESYAPAAGAPSGPCVDFRQAASRAGERGCVTGYVLRAYTSKSGNTFLDFCQDYRSCAFSTVIFASDQKKFGNLETLEGRKVAISGFISVYQSHAEIIVHDPSQIRAAP